MADQEQHGHGEEPRREREETPAEETLGDVLRKERVTRRITLETIARDLKLNVKYIRALEANQYDAIPAELYVRVYLRSLAKYLLLDADEILGRYYKEQGITPERDKTAGSGKMDISGMDTGKKSPSPWIVVGTVVILLALVSYFVNRRGWLQGSGVPQSPPATTDSVAHSADSHFIADTFPDTLEPETTEASETDEDEAGADPHETASSGTDRDPMRLRIRAAGDSVWVQVFSDGVSWKNTLLPGNYRTFTARDSFNLQVGNNRAARYSLNGEPLDGPSDGGVVIFKIGPGGNVSEWSPAKWRRVFKGRLDGAVDVD